MLLTCFLVLVLGGYLASWTWTGFTGNTLWDWLSLALLPLVIATSTLWRSPGRWTRHHRVLVAAGAVVGVLLALAGYLVPWNWTGFVGNTAWDWTQLLLLPVLVPILILPLVIEGTESWMERGAGALPPQTVNRCPPRKLRLDLAGRAESEHDTIGGSGGG